MNIAVVAKKGGVGKSTISLLLSAALNQVGLNAAIVDWDRQGTSSKSCQITGAQLAKPGQNYQFLIYDTKPDLADRSTSSAVDKADVIVILTTPNIPDLWEANETSEYAQSRNPKASIVLLVNRVRSGTRLARGINEAVDIAGLSIPMLKTQIQERMSFVHFLAQGWPALDSVARNAASELALEVATLRSSASTA